MKVFGVTGWKNSGKTTLVSKLVTEIKARGYSVSTIKRTHHNVDLDQPGTDSFKHRSAGAQEVVLLSDNRYALLRELPEPISLPAMIERLDPVDLVLVEGFKAGAHAKIECHRAERERPLISQDNTSIVAIASDTAVDTSLPVLDLNAIADVADWVLNHMNLPKEAQK